MVTLFLALPLLVACSIGDVRRPPPNRASPEPVATTPARPPVADVDEVRVVRVAVPDRYDPPFIEFVDAEQAYALFATCDGRPPGRDCPALLFATRDGGRSWRALPHPRPVAENQQLYAPQGLLVLNAEPFGWYASTDGGATFTHYPGVAPPSVLLGAGGRFQMGMEEDVGKVARWDGRRLRPLAVQPELPMVNTVCAARDLLVAAGAADGRPYASVSTDQGRSWQRSPVPVPDGEVGVLRVMPAPDGEVWLIGERPDPTGFPALWIYRGNWDLVRTAGHPDKVRSVAPVDGGRMAVTGPDGVGVVVNGRYEPVSWPVGPEHYLYLLGDGTLVARAPDEVVLTVGPVGARQWIRVALVGD